MRSPIFLFLALTTSAIIACGGAEPPAKPPVADTDAAAPTAAATTPPSDSPADAGAAATAATSATDSKPAAAEPPGFDDLPNDKKVELMMTKVVPNMGKVFKEHDGKKFAKFTCATCHGAAKKKEAPSKFLPKLTFSKGGYEKLEKSKPAMMKFMNEKVLPAMVDAMGAKPKDPKTNKGFGCNGCHAVD